MKKIIFLMCLGLLVAGCADDKKYAPKEGRIAVSEILDPALPKATNYSEIILGEQENVTLWPQTNATGQNRIPYGKISQNPKQIWSTNIGKGLNADRWKLSEPVVANGIVYALDADFNLSAIRLSDGKRLWKKELPLKNPTAIRNVGLAYSYDKLFAVSGNGTVMCLDLKGNIVWQKEYKLAFRSAPTIYQNLIYLIAADNELILLKTDNGAISWRYKAMAVTTNLLGMGTPAIYKKAAVVPFSNGEVITFDVNSKQVVWSEYLSSARAYNRISELTHILSSPVIADEVVYLIGNAGKMGAYDLRRGKEIWSLPMGGNSTPAITGNTLFAINNQNILVALDKKTGKLFWDLPLRSNEKKGSTLWKGPILAGDNGVVVSSKGDILFVDLKTGQEVKRIEGNGISVSPILVDGTLLLLTDEADLIAYK